MAASIPQNHHRCRAKVYSVSERELIRDGLTHTTEEALSKVPEPDKGFALSPLTPFKPDLMKYTPDLCKAVKAAVSLPPTKKSKAKA